MITFVNVPAGHRVVCGCFQCAPWLTTYATPQGSPLGAIPPIRLHAVGPDDKPPAWRDAITAHQRVLHWLDEVAK